MGLQPPGPKHGEFSVLAGLSPGPWLQGLSSVYSADLSPNPPRPCPDSSSHFCLAPSPSTVTALTPFPFQQYPVSKPPHPPGPWRLGKVSAGLQEKVFPPSQPPPPATSCSTLCRGSGVRRFRGSGGLCQGHTEQDSTPAVRAMRVRVVLGETVSVRVWREWWPLAPPSRHLRAQPGTAQKPRP